MPYGALATLTMIDKLLAGEADIADPFLNPAVRVDGPGKSSPGLVVAIEGSGLGPRAVVSVLQQGTQCGALQRAGVGVGGLQRNVAGAV